MNMTVQYVYVAGPMSVGDVEQNVRLGIDAASALLSSGFYPFVPHLSYYWESVSSFPYETWLGLDFGWLKKCDAIIRLPGMSEGADREMIEAKRLGLVRWKMGVDGTIWDFIREYAR